MMWICQQCQAENHDSTTVCALCGTQRAAGRFAPLAQQRPGRMAAPPRVSAPGSQKRAETASPSSHQDYRVPGIGLEPVIRIYSPLVGFAKAAGAFLLIVPPLLVLLLAIMRYEALAPVLVPLLTGAEGHPVLGILCYAALSLTAILLSALPGLWTLLLARRKG